MSTKATEYREQAAACRAEAAASFERCDTDGFVSQWASGINAQLADAKAAIAEAGGTAFFAKWSLIDAATGEAVDARFVQTRYGQKWRIDATDEWISTSASDKALAKRGYQKVEQIERAAAFAFIGGSGKGLSGATSCYVAVAREGAKASDGWRAVSEAYARVQGWEEVS